MTENSTEDRQAVCAALLTMASISSSYKVESTKAIAELWSDIKSKIPINDDIDYVAIILSLGRIADLQADQINIEALQEIVTSFRGRLNEMGSIQGTITDLGAAYLTSSCVSHSHEVESTTSVVNLWDEFRKNIPVKDANDLASSVLATGRIMDLRADVKSPDTLSEIVTNIRNEFGEHNIEHVDFKELSILLLSAAFIELSPKVEKYRDIVKSWQDLKRIVSVKEIKDIVSLILFSGKIRDMDMSMLMYPSSITDQIGFIRNALDNV
jgi:hypothetical protein